MLEGRIAIDPPLRGLEHVHREIGQRVRIGDVPRLGPHTPQIVGLVVVAIRALHVDGRGQVAVEPPEHVDAISDSIGREPVQTRGAVGELEIEAETAIRLWPSGPPRVFERVHEAVVSLAEGFQEPFGHVVRERVFREREVNEARALEQGNFFFRVDRAPAAVDPHGKPELASRTTMPIWTNRVMGSSSMISSRSEKPPGANGTTGRGRPKLLEMRHCSGSYSPRMLTRL